MAIRLKQIVLFVKDVKKQAAYYHDVLGLQIKVQKDGWIELDAGGCVIALHKGAGRKPRIDFISDECIEAECETLTNRGAKLGDIGVRGVNRYCDGRDPEGNLFEILEIGPIDDTGFAT